MARSMDARLLDTLQQASTLQLYQLHTAIGQMLLDPRRIIAIRQALHVGKVVRFVDWQDGSVRIGTVVALREREATVLEPQAKLRWELPYAAIDPREADTDHLEITAPRRPAARPGAVEVRRGDKVTFDDEHGNTIAGTIVRVNQKTATVDPGDGSTWRVPFPLLRPVIDV